MSVFFRLPIVISLIALGAACSKVDEFKDLGDKVASPVDVANSDDGKYFYVLNSDFDRTYGEGSILVIDEDGKKQGAVHTPRVGRNIVVAGTDLIALFDSDDDDVDPEVRLYDLSEDPTKPKLVKTWSDAEDMDCVPINTVLRKGYDHFAVTCLNGKLFIGTLKSPRQDTTLKLVRDYKRTRRAMHIDTERELLYMFVTDFSFQQTTDLQLEDSYSYDPKTEKEDEETPNEVPDEYEDTEYQRKNSSPARRRYQFVVYDIKGEREKGFEYLIADDPKYPRINKESRWLYFTLKNPLDHTPEVDAGYANPDRKLYRTNFWEAKPDPFDSSSFYLSHRGRNSKESRFVNSIIRVTVVGDPLAFDENDAPPLTPSYLDFNLVDGLEGELDLDKDFPGDFEVLSINGRTTLIVNHFRDLANFKDDHFFGISAKVLDGGYWRDKIFSGKSKNSYYQFAINAKGKALSCAFYDSSVIPLEVNPGTGITIGWDNKDITRIE